MIKFVKLLEAISAWKPCPMITGILCMIIFQDKYQDSRNCIWVWWSYRKNVSPHWFFLAKYQSCHLCQSLEQNIPNFAGHVTSDRMDKFRELWTTGLFFLIMNNFVFKFLIRLIFIRRTSMIICIILWMWNTMQMAGSFYIIKFFGSIFDM